MPTSAPGSKRVRPPGFTAPRRSAEHGFTLVELMIVLVVIGLTSAAVMLAMPDANGRLRDEAARFALRVKAAHDGAIVSARPVSVWVTPGGYGFDERRGGAWVPMEQPRVERWSEGTSATLDARSRVTFDATGMADRPLSVPLVRGRAKARVTIDADGAVDVAS